MSNNPNSAANRGRRVRRPDLAHLSTPEAQASRLAALERAAILAAAMSAPQRIGAVGQPMPLPGVAGSRISHALGNQGHRSG